MAIGPSLLSELKRRNVLRAAALYIGAVWLLAQVITQLGPVFDAPAWIARWFLAAAAVGFPFWIALAWFYELTPEGLKRDSEVAPQDSIRHLTGNRLDRAIIAVLALAVVLLLTGTLMRQRHGIPSGDVATTPDLDRSIAVLPLVNASNDPDQRFFSDGLSENLIDSLSAFGGLKVIGRISAFQFRDSKDDSATIGRKLGVAYLLSGSVQRAGDVVRINASLSRAADGSTLWAEHYDRPYRNLFALQDEIALAVAAALRVKLLVPAPAARQDDRPPSGDLDAYGAYLRGLAYWHDENFPRAAEYMAKAVRRDPDYAMAWALLSGSWSTVAAFDKVPPADVPELMRKAGEAADRALQLAPDLGPAHAARAYLQFYRFDAATALAECRRATTLAPADGTVLNGCGYTLTGMGRLGEALRLREQLLAIEPLYVINYQQYARLLIASGRVDEAGRYLRTADSLPQTSPAWHVGTLFWRMTAAMARRDADAAMDIAGQASGNSRKLFTALAAQLRADGGAAGTTALDGLLGDETVAASSAYGIAQVYALRDDAGHAVEWLERSSRQSLLFLLADPIILRLRDDTGFVAFCGKAGLPPPGESEALSLDQLQARTSALVSLPAPAAGPGVSAGMTAARPHRIAAGAMQFPP
jgi:TolB-like protein/Tfp pilus assembly protein PilF